VHFPSLAVLREALLMTLHDCQSVQMMTCAVGKLDGTCDVPNKRRVAATCAFSKVLQDQTALYRRHT
jgi:hypothetical protein